MDDCGTWHVTCYIPQVWNFIWSLSLRAWDWLAYFQKSRWWHLKGRNSTVQLCDCDFSCLQLAVLVAVIASYLQSRSREWHPSCRPRKTYNLLFVCHGHVRGQFPVEGAVQKLPQKSHWWCLKGRNSAVQL